MNWLRRIIGLEDIYNQIEVQNRYIISLRGSISALASLQDQIDIHNRGISRLIAKLDPIFAEDEFSPERKAASDKLTAEVMRKLIGEHLANNMHKGEA